MLQLTQLTELTRKPAFRGRSAVDLLRDLRRPSQLKRNRPCPQNPHTSAPPPLISCHSQRQLRVKAETASRCLPCDLSGGRLLTKLPIQAVKLLTAWRTASCQTQPAQRQSISWGNEDSKEKVRKGIEIRGIQGHVTLIAPNF